MTIYERLTQDHNEHRELIEKIGETTGDSPERRELWDKLKIELEAHAAAEEQSLYASLMKEPDGQEQARHSVHEHQESSDLIEELSELDMSSPGWLLKFHKLAEELEHHMKEEEDDVFPLARKVLSDTHANELAERFESRKRAEVAAA